MEDLSKLEAQAKTLQESLVALRDEFAKLEEEGKRNLEAFEVQEAEKLSQRKEILSEVDPSLAVAYERVKARFPMDAVAAVSKGSCEGCFMQVGLQTIVLISRQETLVKCPGCARILYIPDEKNAG